MVRRVAKNSIRARNERIWATPMRGDRYPNGLQMTMAETRIKCHYNTLPFGRNTGDGLVWAQYNWVLVNWSVIWRCCTVHGPDRVRVVAGVFWGGRAPKKFQKPVFIPKRLHGSVEIFFWTSFFDQIKRENPGGGHPPKILGRVGGMSPIKNTATTLHCRAMNAFYPSGGGSAQPFSAPTAKAAHKKVSSIMGDYHMKNVILLLTALNNWNILTKKLHQIWNLSDF